MAKRKVESEVGSGNVFKDLGLKNAEELLAKAQLATQIVQILRERKLTQTAAARIMGIDQSKISRISRGRLDDFSIERLMRFLNALGHDLKITVDFRPRRRRRGRMIVEAA